MGETRTAGTGAADEARAILLESKAILEDDHFVYVTGDHGLGWIDKDALFPRTDRVDRLSKLLADAVLGVAEIHFRADAGGAQLGRQLLRRRTRNLSGVGPRSNASRIFRSRYRR